MYLGRPTQSGGDSTVFAKCGGSRQRIGVIQSLDVRIRREGRLLCVTSSDIPRLAGSAGEYAAAVRQATALIDLSATLPAWPFLDRGGVIDFCDQGHWHSFGPVLLALATQHGDESVAVAMVEPRQTVEAYVSDRAFAAFTLRASGIVEGYQHLAETAELFTTADRLVFGGSSGQWAVWADREWELAIVYARVGPATWREAAPDMFVDSLADAIAIAGLAFGLGLPVDQRRRFESTVLSAGELACGTGPSRIELILAELSLPVRYPEDESEHVQQQWMELMDCERLIAGLVSTVIHDGRLSAADIREARAPLAENPRWHDRWPDRFERMAEALAYLDGAAR